MNRVQVQDGYNIPFAGAKRRAKRRGRMSPAMKKQQGKMKACAKKWSGSGNYRSYMKACLKSR